MTKNARDKKVLILRVLALESEPINLNDLMQKAGIDLNKRTVRRWLSKLVEEGIVRKIGEGRASAYQAEKKLSHRKRGDESPCFSSESSKIIQKIKEPLYQRLPVSYNEKWLDSYRPNDTFYLSEQIRSNLSSSGKRSQNNDPAGTYAQKIYSHLLIDLSYNSSRLEGNTYTLLDTKRLLLEGKGAEGKLDAEKIMILNHKEAIRYLIQNAGKIAINPHVVCSIHYLLSDGLVDARDAGNIRNHDVRISGTSYIPIGSPQKLESVMSKITEKASQIEDVFEQCFFLLIHITYLQAFIDVNKRTARLCANIPLIKHNFVPLSFNGIEKDDYIHSMIAIYELQEVGPLTDLFVFSYLSACAAYDSKVKEFGIDEVRVRYRSKRREIIRHVVLENLQGDEIQRYLEKGAKSIPEEDRRYFVEDVMEDLAEINRNRIAGLGITPDQLENWLKNSSRK